MIDAQIATLAAELVQIATEQKIEICAAESCTGGALSAAITSIPGASCIFKGSIVSYSRKAKLNILKIPMQLLDIEGEVSSATSERMVENALSLFAADIGVGITGYAGPSGGTKDYPVGTVFIAVRKLQKKAQTFQLNLEGNRLEIITQSVKFVLGTLVSILASDPISIETE